MENVRRHQTWEEGRFKMALDQDKLFFWSWHKLGRPNFRIEKR